jgi:hypothetical protein
MCEAAFEVTDADVEELLTDWGPPNLTAIVLTLAYANFQDRLFQSLGIEAGSGDPLLPPNIRFDWEALKEKPLVVPVRVVPEPLVGTAEVPLRVDDPAWLSAPLDDLRNHSQSSRRCGRASNSARNLSARPRSFDQMELHNLWLSTSAHPCLVFYDATIPFGIRVG